MSLMACKYQINIVSLYDGVPSEVCICYLYMTSPCGQISYCSKKTFVFIRN